MTHSSGSLLNDVRNDRVRHVVLCFALAVLSFVSSSWVQSLLAAHELSVLVGAVVPAAAVLVTMIAVAPAASMPVLEVSSSGISVVDAELCIPWGFIEGAGYQAPYQLLAGGLTVRVRSPRGTMALGVVPAAWIVSALEDAPKPVVDVLREAVGARSREARDLDLSSVARMELLVFRRRASFAAGCGAITLAVCVLTVAGAAPVGSTLLGVVAAAAMIAGVLWLRARTVVELGDRWVGPNPGESGPLAREGHRLAWTSVLLRRMLASPSELVTIAPTSPSGHAPLTYRTAPDHREPKSATVRLGAAGVRALRVVIRPTLS